MKEKIVFDNIQKIHFIGVGGISMSALAMLAVSFGKQCSGSDSKDFSMRNKLKEKNIKVYLKHKAKNVVGADLVVYSSAIDVKNVEMLKAKQLGLPMIERSEFLGLVSSRYNNAIGISGAHGKTTTTAMISGVFLRYGLNPTVHIGGEYDLISGNLNIGNEEYFITEACEFRDSFLSLFPKVSVITNIESEHLDYFKNFANIKKSFNRFCENTQEVCFINYKFRKYITSSKVVTFGISNKADLQARNLKLMPNGCYQFNCYEKDKLLGRIEMGVEGRHNVLNALATISVCRYYGVPFKKIATSIKQFKNVKRRFENMGRFNGATIVHDYAHHPTEIRACIKTCWDTYKMPIVCVFQPHTYSRTKMLMKSFCHSFFNIEALVLLETYSAREKYDCMGSAQYLKKQIENTCRSLNVYGVFNKKQAIRFLKKYDLCGKVLLFLGAGDIESVATYLKYKFNL